MKTKLLTLVLALSLSAGMGIAQEKVSSPSKPDTASVHIPPPQAYEDCKGKKAGDTVQHTTREGKVTATCEESPNGLVARPIQSKATPAGSRAP